MKKISTLLIMVIFILTVNPVMADEIEEALINAVKNSSSMKTYGTIYKVGPKYTSGNLNEYERTMWQKLKPGDFELETEAEITIIEDIDRKIARYTDPTKGNSAVIYILWTSKETSDESDDNELTENPNFISTSIGNAWSATYDWVLIPDGSYAVEIPIKENGEIKKWKLVQRLSDLIIPHHEIPMQFPPSDGSELKTTFLKNPETAVGNFTILGEFPDKTIWLYE